MRSPPFAMLLLAALAQTAIAQAASTPPNTIDCAQSAKVGPITWNEQGTAVLDFGKVKGTHIEKTPIQPHAFILEATISTMPSRRSGKEMSRPLRRRRAAGRARS